MQGRSKYSSLDQEIDDEEALMPSPKQQIWFDRNQLAIAAATFVVAIMGTLIWLTTTMPSSPSLSGTSSFKSDASTSRAINFSFKRMGYGALPYFNSNNNAITNYAFLKKYIGLIEPYAEMGFHMYDSSEYDVSYSVCNNKGVCQRGVWSATDSSSDAVKFECAPYDTFSVTVKQYNKKNKKLITVSGQAVCLYVRREARKLTDKDMNKFITASRVLNDLSDSEGALRYGPTYKSSSTVVKYHHFNAVQQDQDHIHEGNGFIIQHVKLTNIFESAVQAVDPSVSLPYWDFTIDSAQGLTTDQSYIFTSKMYGQNALPKSMSGWTYADDSILNGRIMDGLWKDLKVDMNPYPGSPYSFGYGYMRAPWNLNPSPYLSRFPLIETSSNAGYNYMPTCANHYDILQFDDLMDFYYQMSYEPHGTLHMLEGGFYGCDLLKPLVDAGYITDYNTVCYYWVFTLKELYRAGAIEPNKGCTVAENIQDSVCGYTCPNNGDDVWRTVSGMLKLGIDATKEGIEDAFKDFVCGGDGGRIFPGDHLESASPADPSFWVIHPTLERLLHAKLLAGGFEGDGTWPTNAKKDYVCNKSNCYSAVTGELAVSESCCYGHYQDDQMYDGLAGSTDVVFGPTNRDTESATNALSLDYSMPYIYDSFDWSHCSENFNTLLRDMHEDMAEYRSADNGERRMTLKRVPRPALQEKIREKKRLSVEKMNVLEAGRV